MKLRNPFRDKAYFHEITQSLSRQSDMQVNTLATETVAQITHAYTHAEPYVFKVIYS